MFFVATAFWECIYSMLWPCKFVTCVPIEIVNNRKSKNPINSRYEVTCSTMRLTLTCKCLVFQSEIDVLWILIAVLHSISLKKWQKKFFKICSRVGAMFSQKFGETRWDIMCNLQVDADIASIKSFADKHGPKRFNIVLYCK